MNEIGISLGLCFFGYLVGSLSPALWITKIVKGVDVRDAGSHHATTTNTLRQAGFFPATIVLILDIAKGYIPTFLAVQYSPYDWVVPITAALAVAGHCWPLYHQFRGGMGLATTSGTFAAVYPLGFPIGIAIVISLTLIIRHSARAAFYSAFAFPIVFYLFGQRGLVIWLAAADGAVLAIRFLSDWNREYKELWLDREETPN